ncbi:sodium/nucleoside cotransporter 2-like [Ornithodoros turicata]|uniref:sodium/nucleoside cotransporter 2-like n=1 Tax=Ornithodoros turicata TaxID=34597 RepID=UPI003138F70A
MSTKTPRSASGTKKQSKKRKRKHSKGSKLSETQQDIATEQARPAEEPPKPEKKFSIAIQESSTTRNADQIPSEQTTQVGGQQLLSPMCPEASTIDLTTRRPSHLSEQIGEASAVEAPTQMFSTTVAQKETTTGGPATETTRPLLSLSPPSTAVDTARGIELTPSPVKDAVTSDLDKREPSASARVPSEDRVPVLRGLRRNCAKTVLVILYHVYLVVGISNTWSRTVSWCNNIKFLTAATVAAYLFLAVSAALQRWVIAPFEGAAMEDNARLRTKEVQLSGGPTSVSMTHPVFYGSVAVVGCCLLLLDIMGNPYRLQSLGGLLVQLSVGYFCSYNRDSIPWIQVMRCIQAQYIVSIAALRWNIGQLILNCVSQKVETFLELARGSSEFVFGYLATGINMTTVLGDFAEGHNVTDVKPAFIFNTISTVFYVSFFVNVMCYYGLIQAVIARMAVILRATTASTPCESTSVAANIFLGTIEAPSMIYPYLPTLTKSELHTVMAGGFTNIAATVLAAYVTLGIETNHLLVASAMSAPAAIACSKILYPETDEVDNQSTDFNPAQGKEQSVFEAASNAVLAALGMMGSVAASSIALLALLAFFDQALYYVLDNIDMEAVTLEELLGWTLAPLAMAMGVPWHDCIKVGQLVGIKVLGNEFIAYLKLIGMQAELQERSVAIATYALCGFGSLGSIGIMMGGLGALCNDRIDDITQLGFRAMWAGSMASFMTASVVGSIIS